MGQGPSDRLLLTLLRALQVYSSQQDTPRLLSTATSLLSTLSNPRNLSLLTAQILSAPAVWTESTTLRSCLHVLGTFQAAAFAILRHEEEFLNDPSKFNTPPGQPVVGGGLTRNEWVSAVISGAGNRSPKWKHALVLGGLYLGFEGRNMKGMQESLRETVAISLVEAVNAALEELRLGGEETGGHAAVLVLNYCFEILTDLERGQVDYDRLLPVAVRAAFFSSDGYRSGYFLTPLDSDIIQTADNFLSWSAQSISFRQIVDVSSQPLVSSMGLLAKLIAYACEQVKDARLVQAAMDDVLEFSQTILIQWQRIKLSQLDAHNESKSLEEETKTKTIPLLWKMLRSTLFTVSIILRSIAGRIIGDPRLANDRVAPNMAIQKLHAIRNLYFISSRLGSNMLTQHTFVYLAAIDILSAYPRRLRTFVQEIRPASLGRIPSNALDRTMDLFFLNTVEHFTFILSPKTNEELLLAATTPYLATGEDVSLLEIFEAAHSVTLAVFSAPQNAEITAAHVPFYVDALFRVFPQSLTPRQFRLAFKTLIKITTPPSALASSHPDLPEILLELVHQRIINPPPQIRPAPYAPPPAPETTLRTARPIDGTTTASTEDPSVPQGAAAAAAVDPDEGIDARTALVLTLIDSLPGLPLPMLAEWLPRTAELIPQLESAEARQKCRDRFWAAVSDGEMDIERSQLCVGWWSTAGGRELVMMENRGGGGRARAEISGALGPSKL